MKEKMEGYDEEKHASVADIMEKIKKTSENFSYAANNIRHATFEVEFSDEVTISTIAECGSNGKAQKLVSIFNELTDNIPMVAQAGMSQTAPFAEGTKVIAKASIDPVEMGSAVGLAATKPGF